MVGEDLPGWALLIVVPFLVWMAVEDDCRRLKCWIKFLGVGR